MPLLPIKKFSKIIATVGPSCESESMLIALIEAGVDVFRLNFSHGNHEQHLREIQRIRKISAEINKEVCILMDLQGPKIRIGNVEPEEGIPLKKGDPLTITIDPCIGKNRRVSTTYQYFVQDIDVGDKILVDDGKIVLKAIAKREKEIDFKVCNDNILKSKKGINLPNIPLTTEALTEKDFEDLKFGLENDVDLVALSFVRSGKDLDLLHEKMDSLGKRLPVISKIEKPDAVNDIENIIKKSYGIMVARGDLGIEVPSEQLPILQKKITKLCNRESKPVIIATQMLDSMIRNPVATRAEITDIANAILDGADALMLSGETAVGNYPLEVIQTMVKVIRSTENEYFSDAKFKKHLTDSFLIKTIDDNICQSSVNIARQTKAKALVCVTHTGTTVRKLSRYKAYIPIYAITNNKKTQRILKLSWGTEVLLSNDFEKFNFVYIEKFLKSLNVFKTGDRVIITAGIPTFKHKTTNSIKIYELD